MDIKIRVLGQEVHQIGREMSYRAREPIDQKYFTERGKRGGAQDRREGPNRNQIIYIS